MRDSKQVYDVGNEGVSAQNVEKRRQAKLAPPNELIFVREGEGIVIVEESCAECEWVAFRVFRSQSKMSTETG